LVNIDYINYKQFEVSKLINVLLKTKFFYYFEQ